MKYSTVNIINVASDIGSVFAGKSRAPVAFTSAGLQTKLKAAGYGVREESVFGDSSAGWASSDRGPNGARNEQNTVRSCESVHEAVFHALTRLKTDVSGQREDTAVREVNDAPSLSSHEHAAEDDFQFILSGECLYTPAIMAAYWKYLEGTNETVGIIYVDADCDLHTPGDASGSGNIAGMTLTHLTLREGCLESMKRFARGPATSSQGPGVVDNQNIALFGLNAGSDANKREHLGWLLDNGFRVVTSTAAQANPQERAEDVLRWMEDRVDRIIVHLDVDVIDPGEFPLGNVPNWTGLGFAQCMTAVQVFLRSEKCVALSVAEVNPDHDPGLLMTKRLVDELVAGLQDVR